MILIVRGGETPPCTAADRAAAGYNFCKPVDGGGGGAFSGPKFTAGLPTPGGPPSFADGSRASHSTPSFTGR